MYERRLEQKERILVICSFAAEEISYRLPVSYKKCRGKLILDNYLSEKEMRTGSYRRAARRKDGAEGQEERRFAGVGGRLQPYEVQVFRFPGR